MVKKAQTDTRRGVNCTLAFVNGRGAKRSFGVRATTITWGLQVVADESQSRTRRAMYPRQVLPSQFMLTPALITYNEFVALMDFLTEYAHFATNTEINDSGTSRMMTVTCTARSFKRRGLLTTGISRGNHIGAMVWSPTMVFETLVDPLDTNTAIRSSSVRYGDAATKHANPDLETKYFYPFGTQLSGSQHGDDYAPVQEPDAVLATTSVDEGDANSASSGSGSGSDSGSSSSVLQGLLDPQHLLPDTVTPPGTTTTSVSTAPPTLLVILTGQTNTSGGAPTSVPKAKT